MVSTGLRVEEAWQVLGTVLDPEVPALSVRDLGIVRGVNEHDDHLEIVLTPTYSGCPATEVIERSVLDAMDAAGLGPARVTLQRAPAWTTDWISAEGRRKLLDYGIAPPGPVSDDGARGNAGPPQVSSTPWGGGRREAAAWGHSVPIRFANRIACPRCASLNTERLSAFGSTACKSLYRCVACREPFEHFKPI